MRIVTRDGLFMLALAATIFCAAVNCYTFQIAYPLWRSVGEGEFAALHGEYLRRLNWIITVPHVVMFFACAGLVAWPPVYLQRSRGSVAFGLVAAVVSISAFAAGPVHDRFTRRGRADQAGMEWLIRISAARVVLMLTASAILLDGLLEGLGR